MNPLGLTNGAAPRFMVATSADGRLLGCGQLKELEQSRPGGALELSSLVVAPEARGQQVGTRLIVALLEQAGDRDVYLTTIGRRQQLYERQGGFRELPSLLQAPLLLALEAVAGTVVAAVVARDRLIVMASRGSARRSRGQQGAGGVPQSPAAAGVAAGEGEG